VKDDFVNKSEEMKSEYEKFTETTD